MNKDELKKYLAQWTIENEPPAKYNYVSDTLERIPGLEFLGGIPHVKSIDVKESSLGIGLETLDRDSFDPVPTFPFLGESGIKYARCQTGWLKCEKEVGVYDFQWLDTVVDGLGKVGIETWFSLSYGHPVHTPCEIYAEAWRNTPKGEKVPNWPRGWVAETPYYHGEKAMQAWRNYVVALAEHFKGRVKIWEVWNEPEGWWRHQGKAVDKSWEEKAADYTDFVRFTAEAVKSVIPDARIGADVAQSGTAYIPGLRQAGLAEYIDIFSYHFYGSVPEEFLRERVEHIRANLVPSDGHKISIFQGESGRSSGKSKLFAMPTELAQARYLTRRYLSDIVCGAELSSFFTATDLLDYYPDGSDSFYGVISTRTQTPKLAYRALQNMGWIFDGLKKAPEYFAAFRPDQFSYFGSMRPYQVMTGAFKRKGIPVFAVWTPEHVDISAQPVTGVMHFLSDTEHPIKNPVIIDPIRGKVWSAEKLLGIQNDGSGFFGAYTLTPFTVIDWPLFITDAAIFDDK